MSLAGIDLGNSRVKIAVPDAQGNPVILANEMGELFTPSVVYFGKDGILVGTEALHAGLLDPTRCVQNWKRSMGTSDALYTVDDGTPFLAKDIARLLLKQAARIHEQRTGELLSEAAISVPANYTDAQKHETREAAKAVGIDVVLMPHEPTAAAFGNKITRRGDGHGALFDLGGGTYDVSVLRVRGNTIDVLATNGEPHLGGQDFNARLHDIILEAFESQHRFRPTPHDHPLFFQDLGGRIEAVKIALSAREAAPIMLSCDGRVLTMEITRQTFADRTRDLVDLAMDRAETTFAEAGVAPNSVREIIPVGGASQMPCFLDAITKRFGRAPAYHAEPNFAVALGTMTMGRMSLEERGEQLTIGGRKLPPLEYRLQEVTAHPVGISTLDAMNQLVNSVVLPKSTPIPSEITKAFQLAEPGQTGALVRVLQGADGAREADCQSLGYFQLEGLASVHDQPHAIDIRFSIDRNGMLTSEARDRASGKRNEMVIDYHGKAKRAGAATGGGR